MRVMAQKFLYIVNHAIGYPSSEYGGIWNVIAVSNEECFDLISNHFHYNTHQEYFRKLRENIINSLKFEIKDETQQSRIVESFIT